MSNFNVQSLVHDDVADETFYSGGLFTKCEPIAEVGPKVYVLPVDQASSENIY
jgi:hypothetical protein